MFSILTVVVIRNSELLLGTLDKTTLGPGGKNNVFFVLLNDWGSAVATTAMNRVSRMMPDYLTNRGFSIGLSDVAPSLGLVRAKENLLKEGYVGFVSSLLAYSPWLYRAHSSFVGTASATNTSNKWRRETCNASPASRLKRRSNR